MNNLSIILESWINGYKVETLDIISLLAIFCSISIIISKNPIVSILYLIGLFGSISSYLILLGLNFLALSYIIVYIGAVSILFLFILMLINIRISELQNNTRNSILLSIFILIFLYSSLSSILPNQTIKYLHDDKFLFINHTKDDLNILFVYSNYWDSNLSEINHISSIGNILYSSHSVWLLIASFILLLAMVGTITITINKSNNS